MSKAGFEPGSPASRVVNGTTEYFRGSQLSGWGGERETKCNREIFPMSDRGIFILSDNKPANSAAIKNSAGKTKVRDDSHCLLCLLLEHRQVTVRNQRTFFSANFRKPSTRSAVISASRFVDPSIREREGVRACVGVGTGRVRGRIWVHGGSSCERAYTCERVNSRPHRRSGGRRRPHSCTAF